MSIDSENTQFRVVINHEEQYSIWPDYKAIPEGWKSVGIEGDKQTCLNYIETTWTDMRPLSLRKAMA
ncbi:MbtH family protein [Pseudomonas huanghezhanensis]|uniref:MbtH family protein n=1 Tax=Pseudomonas huanghezhanensis TaxID=3002903 RepID=UPI0022854C6E|nr:MbtH family NRPS accessory protein [Pseudomonas sp. BSw22131]